MPGRAKSQDVAHIWYRIPECLGDPPFIGSLTARQEPLNDGALYERFGLQALWARGPTQEWRDRRGPTLLSIQELVRALGTTTLLATGSGRRAGEAAGADG